MRLTAPEAPAALPEGLRGRLLPASSDLGRARTLVRAAGLEPALPCEKRILSPLRLPFRHARTGLVVYTALHVYATPL